MIDFIWKPESARFRIESNVHPHVEFEKSNLFTSDDDGSTEYEVLNWLHSTIRLLKPNFVLETGAYHGLGTVAMAHACKLNGFGKIISIEKFDKYCSATEELLEKCNLKKYSEVYFSDSLEFLEKTKINFDIAFFDSETTIRAKECEICFERNILQKLAVFHDTSKHRLDSITPIKVQEQYRKDILKLSSHKKCSGFFESNLSRGFMALWLTH